MTMYRVKFITELVAEFDAKERVRHENIQERNRKVREGR